MIETDKIDQLIEKQQLTNELLLATYKLLIEFMDAEQLISRLPSDELEDYFTEKVLQDSTNNVLDEIGGLWSEIPSCPLCGEKRTMLFSTIAENYYEYECKRCNESVKILTEEE